MVNHNSQKDKYVTFKSGDEYFGLKIEYVNEIIVFQREVVDEPYTESQQERQQKNRQVSPADIEQSCNFLQELPHGLL